MNSAELVERFPRLYHMAEYGSWPSIRERGLLSTSALLDLYQVQGQQRQTIERQHRPDSTMVSLEGLPDAVIRDQKPMSDNGLRACLQDGLRPEDWYLLLNGMSFFWLTEERLVRLLNARPYRASAHDVLVADTESVMTSHFNNVRLCPMNSGCTKPYPRPRGVSTFLPIADYPFESWDRARRRVDPIVEFAVIGGVLDIAAHAIEVRRMQRADVLEQVWQRE